MTETWTFLPGGGFPRTRLGKLSNAYATEAFHKVLGKLNVDLGRQKYPKFS